MTLLQSGRVAEALEAFKTLSRDARRDPEVWHLLGACYSMQGDHVRCEECAHKAIALMPSLSGAWSNLGTALHSQGRLAEAEAALRQAVRHSPTDAIAHSNLGSVYHAMKKTTEAEQCYREALRLRPDFPDALTNLGLVMQERGELAEAVALHRRALALDPQHADAYYNLGYALMLQGDAKSAIPFLERVTQINPNAARGWISLGGAYARLHDQKQALQYYERGVSLDPHNVENLSTLGACYLALGERDKAVAVLTRAHELKPDDGETRYWLAAAGVGEAPEKMAMEAVTKLFDGYAGNFDSHLVGTLHYRTPAFISTALRRARGNDARPFDLLDIGCGTGLLGVEIRDIAGHLAGVDLSPKMIEHARKRGIYQELHVREIIDFMRNAQRRFDGVLSADVFVYLGDLDAVFAATCECLTSDGLFIFSVESHSGHEPYHLRPSGRYAHSLPYLRDQSMRHGFEEISVDNVTLRTENGVPVEGYVVVLRGT
jgi:predicted TPR repeat methyltransferase